MKCRPHMNQHQSSTESHPVRWRITVYSGWLSLCLAVVLQALPGWAEAAPGELDASFGTEGVVLTSVGPMQDGFDVGRSVVQLASGKLLVTGSTSLNANADIALVRYNADGSLDTSFGRGGKVTTNVGPSGDVGWTVLEDSNGKLVVAGHADNGSNDDFALVRYNADGSLDTSFGNGGKVTTAVQNDVADSAYSVIEDNNARLVVAGYSGDIDSSREFALVRYNGDGSLDTSFGDDGKVTTAVGQGGRDEAFSVIEDSSGKLVVAGRSYDGTNWELALARYNTNGSLDTSLDGDGKVTTPIGDRAEAYSVIEDSNGRLVVAGWSYDGSDSGFALARYDSDGSLDTSLDSDGKVVTVLSDERDQANSVIEDSNGRLVVAGRKGDNGGARDFALVRYNDDGSLDASFDSDGKVTTEVGNEVADGAYSVIEDNNDKLVVAGYSGGNGSSRDFALVRYDTDGSLDASLDDDGKVTTGVGRSDDTVSSVIEDSNERLVVAGYSWINGTSRDAFTLARYNADGTLDTSFDNDGKVITVLSEGGDEAHSVIEDSNGKLVVAGKSWNGSNDDFALVRYNADGSLDTSFGIGGQVTTDIAASVDVAYSVIEDSSGKLVAAGKSYVNGSQNFALVRYNADGSLDTDFGSGGIVSTAIGTDWDHAYSVVEDSNGKLVAAGLASDNGADWDFALVRYNPDGSRDSSFGNDGKVVTAVSNVRDQAYSVIEDSNGKLVAAGYSNRSTTTSTNSTLIRYNADGSLDTSFDGDGIVSITTDSAMANSVVEDSDGRLVVAGQTYDGRNSDFILTRYNTNGFPDTDFGEGDGVAILDTLSSESGRSVVQTSDGNYVVAGHTEEPGQFVLARFMGDKQPVNDTDTSTNPGNNSGGLPFGTLVLLVLFGLYRHKQQWMQRIAH